MSNLNTLPAESTIDIAAIYRVAKTRWLRESAPKPTFADQLPKLRFGLLLAAFVAMFMLSAAHTAATFSRNVDSWVANVAPVAFEVALIGFTLSTTANERRNRLTNITIALIVIATVIANGVSGVSVAATGSPKNQDLYKIFALIVAPVVPFSTIVIGHLLSDTLLQWRTIDRAADAWNAVEIEVLYRATQAELVKKGVTPGKAGRLAFDLTRGYLGTSTIALLPNTPQSQQTAMQPVTIATEAVSVQPSVMPTNGTDGTDVRTDNGHNGSGNGSTNTNKPSVKRNPNALDDLRTWVRTNQIDVTNLSVDDFWVAAKTANVQTGRTSAAQVLAELQEVKA